MCSILPYTQNSFRITVSILLLAIKLLSKGQDFFAVLSFLRKKKTAKKFLSIIEYVSLYYQFDYVPVFIFTCNFTIFFFHCSSIIFEHIKYLQSSKVHLLTFTLCVSFALK